jgi:hypothetical protein
MSFSDYRFAIKVRCNLFSVKPIKKRIGLVQSDRCSRCSSSQSETTAHVLHCCPPKYWLDDGTVQSCLAEACRGAVSDYAGTEFLDQRVLRAPGRDRPDLVIFHEAESKAILTIPFE